MTIKMNTLHIPKLNLYEWIIFISLCIIGVLGNVYSIPLFFGVDFLLGSIAATIVLQRYGLVLGILSGLIASLYTVVLWKHPYAIVFLTCEIIWLGVWLARARRLNLVWYDILYWLLVGIPLIWLSFTFLLKMPQQVLWMIALKWAINGIFNALCATFIIAYTANKGKNNQVNQYTLSFQETIYNSITIFSISFALVVMIMNTRLGVNGIESDIKTRLKDNYQQTQNIVKMWLSNDLKALTALAQQDMEKTEQLQITVTFLHKLYKNFMGLYVADANNTIIASAPLEERSKSTPNTYFFDKTYEQRLKSSTQPIVSDVFSNISPVSIIMMSVPILKEGKFIGYSEGIINLTHINEWLLKSISSKEFQMTIVDRNDHVIVTTLETETPAKKFSRHRSDELKWDEDQIIALWTPNSSQNQSAIARWKNSFFVYRMVVDERVGWQLIVEIPLASYQTELFDLYLKNLLFILVISFALILLANRVSMRMVVSLRQLSTVTSQVTDHVLNHSLVELPKSSIDEVSHLIDNFQKMMISLQEQFHQVEAANSANIAKDQFLANMSHELRTPLNGILGYAQILIRDKTLSQKQHEGVEVIQRSGEYLLTLINDILDLAKITAQRIELDIKEFQFDQFLQTTVELFNVRAEQKGIAFNYKALSHLPAVVRADDKRVRQILINLLGNAVKFTQQGGVTLKVRYVDETVHFLIEDTGVGISPKNLTTIFQPFEQVRDNIAGKAEGTGLGLSITKKLIEMMQGELKVSSELGKGSLFEVILTLPTVTSPTNIQHKSQHTIIGIKEHQYKILIVDDKSENRSVLRHLLLPLGFSLVEAENGKKGLERVIDEKPDLILTDLVMPIMDGFELIRRIRRLPLAHHIPIIVVSASVFDFHQQQSIQVGGDDFLPKPIHMDILLDRLQKFLNIKWLYDEEGVKNIITPEDSSDGTTIATMTQCPLTVKQAARLYDLGLQGDISGIRTLITELQNTNKELNPLLQQIEQAIKSFDSDTVCELVTPYLA